MNIGVMQLANINVSPTKKLAASQSTHSIEINQPNKFREVFNSTVSVSTVGTQNKGTRAESTEFTELKEVLNANSVEEVLDLLGILHEQGLLMLQEGEEGRAVAVDELMDLHSLLDILNMEQGELNTIVSELFGEEELEISNIWQLVEMISKQAPKLVGELASALQGGGDISSKEAKAFIEFLKLTQLAGKQSDLVINQVEQITALKELLQSVVHELQPQEQQSKKQASTFERIQTEMKTSLQGNQQVVTETIETQGPATNTTQQTTTRTVTITLPNTNQAAQSEALVKEFQNLLNRSQIGTTQGTMKLLLKLYPENLGSIRIEVMQKDGMLSVRLLASTQIGKELLDNQVHQLRNSFAQANIQMDRIDIAQSLQESDLNKDQSLFSNLFSQQQNEEEEQTEEESDGEEKLSFKDLLVNEEV